MNDSGIVDHALETISRFSAQSLIHPGAGQTLESACRLMQTIAQSPLTQQSLAQKGAVEALLAVQIDVSKEKDLDVEAPAAVVVEEEEAVAVAVAVVEEVVGVESPAKRARTGL